MSKSTLEARPTQCELALRAIRGNRWTPFEAIVEGFDETGRRYRITQKDARKNELQRAGHNVITRMRKRDPELDGADYTASDWRLTDGDEETIADLVRALAIISKASGETPRIIRQLRRFVTPQQALDIIEQFGGHRAAAKQLWREYIDPYAGKGVTSVRGCLMTDESRRSVKAAYCAACVFSAANGGYCVDYVEMP